MNVISESCNRVPVFRVSKQSWAGSCWLPGPGVEPKSPTRAATLPATLNCLWYLLKVTEYSLLFHVVRNYQESKPVLISPHTGCVLVWRRMWMEMEGKLKPMVLKAKTILSATQNHRKGCRGGEREPWQPRAFTLMNTPMHMWVHHSWTHPGRFFSVILDWDSGTYILSKLSYHIC